MKILPQCIALLLLVGCRSPHILTSSEMQQHLHTQGVDSFVYDCPTPAIANLRVESSTVESLFFVHDLKLTSLDISSTCITDVSPLSGHRLLSISFDTQLVTNGISAVRHMRTLQKINGRRPAETQSAFWLRPSHSPFFGQTSSPSGRAPPRDPWAA